MTARILSVLFAGTLAMLAVPATPAMAQSSADRPTVDAVGRMPWPPATKAAAAFAVQNLQDLLLRAASDQRGVHVETLMTMVGALAGFAAQHATRETVVKTGRMPEHGGKDHSAGAFVVVGTRSGEKFYFGDLLNSYLVPQNAPLGSGQNNLWSLLAAAVKASGGEPLGNDQVAEIFRNAAGTVGAPQFGIPRLPAKHRPRTTPRQALNALWPAAIQVLNRNDAPGAEGHRLPPGQWPTIIALAAQRLIHRSKHALDPTLSMRIVLEAAVPMSKVDPETVPRA